MIVGVSLFIAWEARTFVDNLDLRPPILFGLLAIVVYLTLNYAFRLYHRIWRFASAGEVVVIAGAVGAGTAILGLVDVLWPTSRLVPISVVPFTGLFAFVGFVGVRYRRRLWTGLRWRWRVLAGEVSVAATRVLIVGAGEAGQLLAWRFINQKEGRGFRVVGFVDDAPDKLGMRVHGLPVLGNRHAIPDIVAEHQIDLIIIAIFNISGPDIRGILDICEPTPAVIKVIPNVFDFIKGSDAPAPMRNITTEDLLGRQTASIDREACRGLLTDRVVLVTGAAGSIGSELCRQILGFGPRQLLMVDNNESGLHDLWLTLKRERQEAAVDGDEYDTVTPIIADVTNRNKMHLIFDTYRPRIVFHAAAYKHVPLMEMYPDEAVRVNVCGTRVVAGLSAWYGVDRFVLISTDKAINPESVMGGTKRLGEMILAHIAASDGVAWACDAHEGGVADDVSPTGHTGRTIFTAVRFGNVLGSRGSVVPTFERQIDQGGPVTVTHPDVTRFLISIPEAVSLVIEAATLTQGNDVFMLDMGESICIDTLARRLIRLRGLRPDVDIPVVYTGLRPGEKMHEELLGADEERQPTTHPRIFRIVGHHQPESEDFGEQVERLLAMCDTADTAALTLQLWRIVGATPPTVEPLGVGTGRPNPLTPFPSREGRTPDRD